MLPLKMNKAMLGIVITSTVGVLGGFLYWKYVGCAGGTCPIWSNPYISSIYGGVLGFFIGETFIK